MTLLEIRHLTLFFEGLMAVNDFSWQVDPGKIMGLIGPNGAGKTTVFNLITGVLKPREGLVRFNGREITGRPPHAVCREGIGRTFQNIRLLPEMTVLENVLMAFHGRLRSSFWGRFSNFPVIGGKSGPCSARLGVSWNGWDWRRRRRPRRTP